MQSVLDCVHCVAVQQPPSILAQPLIPNLPCTQLYVCGWAKRGPTGIIGTNLVDADDTLASLAEDLAQGALRSPVPTAAPVPNTIVPPVPASQAVGAESLMQLLSARGRGAVVDWAGWGRLDGAEVAAGRAVGKVREKLVRVEDMLRACECGTVKT